MHVRHAFLPPQRVAAVMALLLAACFDPESPARATGPLVPEADAAGALAITTITPTWVRDTGGVSVATDASDNVFTARGDYNAAGDIWVAKRNSAGALLWEARFDNTDNTRWEMPSWVGTDKGGNVLVSGTIKSGFSNPVNANSVLMKFSPTGALLWRQVYGTPFDGSSTVRLVVDAADNIYVLGLGNSPSGMRTTIRKFAPNGSTVWTWFDPLGIGGPLNLKPTPDGAFLVMARAYTGSTNGYAKVTASGTMTWSYTANSLPVGDAAGDAAGNTYLVNGNYATGSGSLLRKVGPLGGLTWEKPVAMTAIRVEVGGDNAPILGGYPNGTYGAAFAKYDVKGTLLWSNLDADGPSQVLLAIAQMRLDANGDAYLAAGNMSQMGVVKVLNGTGATAWMSLVPFGYAYALAFGQTGAVFVVGGTVARLDPGGAPPPPPPPPTNTPPVVTIAALNGTTIPTGGTLRMQATLVDPDVGDGPWTWTWKWGIGPTTGTWTAPGTYQASRFYKNPGTYNVSVIVKDARGAVDTSNVIRVTIQ